MISKAAWRVSFHFPSTTLLPLPSSISRSSFLHSLGDGSTRNWPAEMAKTESAGKMAREKAKSQQMLLAAG